MIERNLNEKTALELVEQAYPGLLRLAVGLEVIVDIRQVESDFFASVNDIQQGVINKRRVDGRLQYFSALPQSAKAFVLSYIDRNYEKYLKERIVELDVVAARQGLTISKFGGLHDARKRWSSGVFVMLPRSNHVICVERMSMRTLPDTFDYWSQVEAEAARLGPLNL